MLLKRRGRGRKMREMCGEANARLTSKQLSRNKAVQHIRQRRRQCPNNSEQMVEGFPDVSSDQEHHRDSVAQKVRFLAISRLPTMVEYLSPVARFSLSIAVLLNCILQSYDGQRWWCFGPRHQG